MRENRNYNEYFVSQAVKEFTALYPQIVNCKS